MGLNIKPINNDAEFENDSVDPGFSSEESEKMDSISENSSENLKDVENLDQKSDNDAMNLNNDRENGAYNPKII